MTEGRKKPDSAWQAMGIMELHHRFQFWQKGLKMSQFFLEIPCRSESFHPSASASAAVVPNTVLPLGVVILGAVARPAIHPFTMSIPVRVEQRVFFLDKMI